MILKTQHIGEEFHYNHELIGTHLVKWNEPFHLEIFGASICFAFGTDENVIKEKKVPKFSGSFELYHENVAYNMSGGSVLQLFEATQHHFS